MYPYRDMFKKWKLNYIYHCEFVVDVREKKMSALLPIFTSYWARSGSKILTFVQHNVYSENHLYRTYRIYCRYALMQTSATVPNRNQLIPTARLYTGINIRKIELKIENNLQSN